MEPRKIVALLYKFCESPQAIIGCRLCETLVQEGYDLLVTSTSTLKERKAEKEAAEWMTKMFRGSIQIVEPEAEEFEEPSPELIAKLHKTYFGQLTNLAGVHAVIGILPGTSQTAVELKKILRCRLVLLATTYVPTVEELKKEVRKLILNADEVWSMGSDLYSYYDDVFREQANDSSFEIPHKEIMLKPGVKTDPKTNRSDENRKSSENNRLVTSWNNAYTYFFKGKEQNTTGSKMESFFVFCSALERIQKASGKLDWNIHGVKANIVEHIRGPRCNTVKIEPFPDVQFLRDLSWKHCLAFVAPDFQDESFNFLALTAMWLGIPTLVSKESSVGKFLLSLNTPLKSKPIVHLTGNSVTDRKVWASKIEEELQSKENNPTSWAKDLAEFLQNAHETWKLDLSVLNKAIATKARIGFDNTTQENSAAMATEPVMSSFGLKVKKILSFYF